LSTEFSIVIPTFNRVGLLRETVESALRQEGFGDYEVVVVDDCSEDGTWDYLRGLRDPRLKAIRNEPRLGMGPNWNKAVRSSAGRFVFLLQDDDLAMPNLLARASALLGRHADADLVCFATCLIDGAGGNRRVIWQAEREQLLPPPRALLYFARDWTLSSTQVIFARRLFDDYGGFDTAPPIMSDAEAILRWMIYAPALLTPEVLALRRAWDGSVTTATTRSRAMEETMQYLSERVQHSAASSGNLDDSQIDELQSSLRHSFVEPYRWSAPKVGMLQRLWAGLSSGRGVEK
jgi:glycosyltransferase involved in cell wall biosynthesis